jgi:hypothetical protein
MQLRRLLLLIIIFMLSFTFFPVQAQETDDEPISLEVLAAYDHFFRPNFWLPLKIQIRNDGMSIRGRISVRPETTGRNIETAFSTPIELPNGSEKTVFLYIQAREGADRVLVELISDDGVRVAERWVGLSGIHHQDSLHVVVSGTAANSLTLSGVTVASYHARQARWEVSDLPPQYQALMAINTVFLYDVNSEDFSVGQREAIQQWVSMGGHLIVIGGPNWTQTATSLNDWLPFLPTSNQNINDISVFNSLLGFSGELTGRTFVTTGNVRDDARILLATEDGLPLVIRGEMGLGTVDYLTIDPSLEPFRSWEHQQDFWIHLINSRAPLPGWIRGILDQDYAARSVAILPGINLLPSVISMIGFILAYILLIGPVNYWVLSRLNRRALAWLTIPFLIGVFITLAWTVGFNLRGNEVIVSRQFVVQSFVGQDIARQDELIGIFSPRRETYKISAPLDTFMEVLPSLTGDTILQPGVKRSTVKIVQAERFIAEDVAIDGGIFSNFAMMNTTQAPAIEGHVTLSHDSHAELGGLLIRGIVRNESEITLDDVLIFAHNRFYRLSEPFVPGDLLDFDTSDFTIIHAEDSNLLAFDTPLANAFQLDFNRQTNSLANVQSVSTAQVFLGTTPWTTQARFRDDLSFIEDNSIATNRRRALLYAFMRDQYGSNNMGNRVFLMGWSDEAHSKDIVIENTNYRTLDTTLYIVELETEQEAPVPNQTITVGIDQFTWSFLDRSDQSFGGINDFVIINPGWLVLRFTPIEGSVLANVSYLKIEVDRSSSYGREMSVELWNWQTERWDEPDALLTQAIYEYENPTAYLGPDNTVDLRLGLDRNTPNLAASVRVRGVRITQIGTFE